MTPDPICGKCGTPIKPVDLRGTAFFEHASKDYATTWHHVDPKYNHHQATPVKYR